MYLHEWHRASRLKAQLRKVYEGVATAEKAGNAAVAREARILAAAARNSIDRRRYEQAESYLRSACDVLYQYLPGLQKQ